MKSIRNRMRFLLIVAVVGIFAIFSFSTYFFQEQKQMEQRTQEVQQSLADSQKINYLMSKTLIEQQKFFHNPSAEQGEATAAAIQSVKETATNFANAYKNYPKIESQFTEITKKAIEYEKELGPLVNMYKLVGFTEDEGLHQHIQTSYESFNGVIESVNSDPLKNSLLAMKVSERNYINEPNSEQLSAFKTSSQNFKDTIKEMDLDAEQSATLNRNLLKYEQTINSMDNTFNQANAIRTSFESIAADVSSQADLVMTTANELHASLIEEQQQRQQWLTTLLAIIGGIILLVILTTGVFLIRSIKKSIDSLKESATIIGDGDLSHRVDLTSKDEMAELGLQFNHMAARMEQSVRKVLQATGVLNTSSESLTSISDQT
ncbi:HAMP domain-containing protein, partial [Halobacillus trueperi]